MTTTFDMKADSLSILNHVKPQPGLPSKSEAQDTAEKFESLLVNLLLSRMADDEDTGSFFGQGPGAGIQKGLFFNMLSQQVTTNGPGLGVAEQLVADWARRGWTQNADEEKGATQ